jgi:hypothetical protein
MAIYDHDAGTRVPLQVPALAFSSHDLHSGVIEAAERLL